MRTIKSIIILVIIATGTNAFAQNAYFKTTPSNISANDGFGWAVSLDGNNAVVTAARADGISADQGAAWVYKIVNHTLTAPQQLTHPSNQSYAHFGNDAAIEGSNLIVSAYGANDKGAHAGAVHYYKFDGTNWNFVQTLYASDPKKNDHFGFSIDLSGDLLIVGAPGIQSKHHKGKAYIFKLQSNGQWKEEKILTPKKVNPKSAFGWDVAINSNSAAVSDVYANTTTFQTGSVDLFTLGNSQWTYETTLAPDDAESKGNEMYGCSIDLDNGTIAIGASRSTGIGIQNGKGTYTGAVFVYKRINTNWRLTGRLTGDAASNDNDFFGANVALHKDALVVGCSQDDFMAKNAGSAYVFIFKGNSWVQVNKFLASDGGENDYYGSSVAINNKTILVGARLGEDDSTKADHGNVYLHADINIPLNFKEVEQSTLAINNISVQPNPVEDHSKVVIRTKSIIEVVSVYHINGKLMGVLNKRETIGEDEYSFPLDLNLQTGMYLVNVKLNDATYNFRIIKN